MLQIVSDAVEDAPQYNLDLQLKLKLKLNVNSYVRCRIVVKLNGRGNCIAIMWLVNLNFLILLF